MRKLTLSLIFVLLLALFVPTVAVFADGSGGEPTDTVTESTPSREKYLDFSSPLTDDDNSFLSFTPKTQKAKTEVVRTADGGAYYRLAHFESELDTCSETTYTNISFKTDLEVMSYVVIEYDMASDSRMYEGFYMFSMARDKDSKPSSKGSAKIDFLHNEDGTLYAKSNNGDIRYLGADTEWHNYTWIFEVVSYSPINTVMDAHVFIDGEFFTTFQGWIDPSATRYFSMIRLNAPLTAKEGEGIILDNVRARSYGNDYVGGIDKLLDGTYSSLYDWTDANLNNNHKFTGDGAYAKLGDTYYTTLEEAIAAAEDGSEITLLRTPDYPVLVNKSVTLLYAGENFKYSSFTHKGVYDSENGNLAFSEAEDGDKITVNVEDKPYSYVLGSYPVYTDGGMLSSYKKDGVMYELTGYTVNGTLTDTVPNLTAEDGGMTVKAEFTSRQPLFSVVKDNTETLYYNYTDLYTVSKSLGGGETVRLLCDITVSGGMPTVKVTSGKTVNFDFNGYSVKCESATTLFTVSGKGSVLNVYSSEEGATFFGKTKGADAGSTFVEVIGSAVCNVGDCGDNDGENISVYTASLAKITGRYTDGTVNFNGGSYYKNVDSYDSFVSIISGGNFNSNGAMFVATEGTVTFDLAADGYDKVPSRVRIKNSSIINLDANRGIVETLPNMATFTVESSFCYNVTYMANNFVEGTSEEIGRIVFDRYCTFDENLAKTKFNDYVTVADGVKTVARVNRTPNYEIVCNTFGEEHDYTLVPCDTDVRTSYTYYTEESEVVDIDWNYFGKVTSEVWLKGEMPVAPFEVPENSGGIVYSMPEIVEANEYAFYSISMKRDFDVFMNLNLYSSFDLNLYLPVSPEYTSVSFAGQSVDLKTLDKTEIDGIEYYVLEKSAIAYSEAGTDYSLALKISAVDGQTFSNSITVSVAQYLKTVRDRIDYSLEDKQLISELIIFIDKKYTEEGKTCPSKIKDLIAVPA